MGESPSAVRNDFVSFVSSLQLDPDEVLVSFDVVSLFTNVPVDLAFQVASRRLDSSLAGRTKLSVDNIVNLLTLCLNAAYFTLRGVVYQQVFGTAMGYPVSVVVANLVMEDVEERELRDISTPIFDHMSRYKIF